MNILTILESVGISGFLDIAFMSVVIYSVLVWFKRTKAAFVVIGMFIFGGIYLLARQLDLSLTVYVFQGFFAILLIAVVIIFQEEIRHFLEQLATRSMITKFHARKFARGSSKDIDILVTTLKNFSRDRIGAIIVLRGKDPVVRHVDGGVNLNGELSVALLGSIFMPNSPGHDGAAVIINDRVTVFSCYLPLSKNVDELPKTGTRHAAALGLSERTDALCLVVSEERGTISIARRGRIEVVQNPDQLPSILNSFFQETTPVVKTKSWRSFFSRNYREKVIAVTVTSLLWFFLVHEARIDYRTFTVPLHFENLRPGLIVEQADPSEVEITLSGRRRAFYFINADRITATVDLSRIRKGEVKRAVSRSDISLPEGLMIETIQPNEVSLRIGTQER
jgi:diadenylate cyclase